ncbi:hypothetical protein [Maribacter sp. Asnod1-A12]|uniref:hypothetical protein n=1 Tax=Maribacter sp. Asnod1-A12 TaxID=3160576 RepID=UPI003869C583
MDNKEKDELLKHLQTFQSDYFSKGKAKDAYTLLAANSSTLKYLDENQLERVKKYNENLKNCERISNIDDYAEKFAANLLKIILILKLS